MDDKTTTASPTNRPTNWSTPDAVKVGWMSQFRYFCGLYERIKDVPGDVVECGIGEGNTFTMLAYLIGSEGKNRTLRGFDSFEGFPAPVDADKSWRDPKQGEWKIGEDKVRERLKDSGILEKYKELSFVLTPGFLGETLPHEKEKGYAIAFLHLDVDIYTSYKDGLEHLFPLVSPGGVVLFDEYKYFSLDHPEEEKWPGATKAIDEYLKPLGYVPEYHEETRKYYIVKR